MTTASATCALSASFTHPSRRALAAATKSGNRWPLACRALRPLSAAGRLLARPATAAPISQGRTVVNPYDDHPRVRGAA
ncbi:hypothetical protein GEMMAAP_11335 [Gemmatimonas phototrophica]|uniref:Uncharacterized protein n=1 Tax=Gemmatimonas phototrophica TaxID=1379270 RepID=A0A143BL52_9BACT|nr:hypothetical protein GEMMAAP_11335 [Gemmatimonas phototrophica]